MKQIIHSILSIFTLLVLTSCSTTNSVPDDILAGIVHREKSDQNRMLVWQAWLSLEVTNVRDSLIDVAEIAKQSGGYIESQSDSGETQADIIVRVPADSLKSAMASLESIGNVTRRRVSSEDVTEQYVDIDARLKTKIALRDRLRALLDKAQNVTDVLAIEKELSRVQADIDSMQAKLEALKGKVDLASITVSIERKIVLGPLGHVLKGIFWTIEKLFVIEG